MKVEEINSKLQKTGYCSNTEIDYAVLIAMATHRPLLIEGAPGVGKTSLAKAVANAFDLPFIRIQMYDGLTDDKIIYDYDYQKQLLTLEAIKPFLEGACSKTTTDVNGINEFIHKTVNKLDFYGKDFMIERPLLKAINGNGRKVILIDEIDKAPEEIEYMLYEFLEDYSITIPQYGTIACPQDQLPIVFITSNGYRDISEAFKRRCNYLYMDAKTNEEMVKILMVRAGISNKLATGIALCLSKANTGLFSHVPAVSEGIEWAAYLKSNPEIKKEIVMNSLGMLVKNSQDKKAMQRIVAENGDVLWN